MKPREARSMMGPTISMARRQLAGLVAVFCAVLGGAAMITAGLVIGETALTSHLPAQRLAPADIVVSAPQSFPVPEDLDIALPERVTVPAELAEQIAALPGVEHAVNDLPFETELPGLGPVHGFNWEIAALNEPDMDGSWPTDPGEAVISRQIAAVAGLGTGDEIEIMTSATEPLRLEITGVVAASDEALYVDPLTATQLRDRPDGRADLVAVTVEPGADVEEVAAAVETALGERFVVSTGSARGDVERIDSGAARGELIALAGSLAGTLLIVVGCIVAGALSVSVAGQRRDLALLRALGATPRQVRRLVANQACAVAVIALIPGIVAGYLLAGALAQSLTDAEMMPVGLPLARSPIAATIVTVLVLVTVQFAARGAARRASQMSATEAVAESRVEPREPSRVRAVIGLVVLLLALGPALVPLFLRSEEALIASASATLLGLIAVALLGPVLVRAITGRAVKRLGDRTGFPWWLAVKNSHAYALRTAGSMMVLSVAIGLIVTQFYVQTTAERTTAAELEQGTVADATLTGPLSAADVAALESEPEVTAAVPVMTSTVIHTHQSLGDATTTAYPVSAWGHGADQVIDPDVSQGDLADLIGDAVALSSATARAWKAQVGDHVDIVLADGTSRRVEVVAVYERGFGFGSAMVSTDLLARFAGNKNFELILLAGDPSAAQRWAADRSSVQVTPGSALIDDSRAAPEAWINMMVLLALLGYVLLAVANSLVASTLRRRDELVALRVVGATRRQVLAMVNRETTVLAVLSIGTGLVLSLVPMSLLGWGIAGRPWPQGPWWLPMAISALVALIAYSATRAAAGRALRSA